MGSPTESMQLRHQTFQHLFWTTQLASYSSLEAAALMPGHLNASYSTTRALVSGYSHQLGHTLIVGNERIRFNLPTTFLYISSITSPFPRLATAFR